MVRPYSCIIDSCSNACWELCTMLAPSMHCDVKLLIVTIVEIHELIVDVCVSYAGVHK